MISWDVPPSVHRCCQLQLQDPPDLMDDSKQELGNGISPRNASMASWKWKNADSAACADAKTYSGSNRTLTAGPA